MQDIVKIILTSFTSLVASIMTAYLIYIYTKKHDVKLERRLETIESDIKHIKHELELDDTIETHVINLYKFLNYYYKKYINNKNIEVIDEIAGTIIKYADMILKNNMLTKDRVEQVEMLINNLIDCLKTHYNNINYITELIEYLEIYKQIIIDIIFDSFNKKETRFVRETQNIIKYLFINIFYKGVENEINRQNQN